MTTYVGFFDGSITHNPGGDMGIGCVLYEVTEEKKEKIFQYKGFYSSSNFPNGTSNNVAECLALNKLLEFLIEENLMNENITIFGDSQIVINRAISRNTHGKGIFIPHIVKMVVLLTPFNRIRFKWCKREENTEADLLSKVIK